jgi:Protein of unknown function DUF262/Protein of unknown function (DUF1524)
MKADAIPVTKLFEVFAKAYVIPGYQRPFAWGPDKAIEFLDAIQADANEGELSTSIGTFLFYEVKSLATRHPHGNNTPNTIAPSNIWQVIDGQQRLTVLSMIGIALDHRLTVLQGATPPLNYSPAFELKHLYRTKRKENCDVVPILIRDIDNFDGGLVSEISRFLNKASSTPPRGETEIEQTFDSINKWIERLDENTFQPFCDYLLTKCQCIQVVADDEDGAFRMFEALNSTGSPLTAFEVFRSKALRERPEVKFDKTEQFLDYDNSDRDQVTKNSNELIFVLAQTYSGYRCRKSFVHLKKYLDSQLHSQEFMEAFETGAQFLKTVWGDQSATDTWFDAETKDNIQFLKASKHQIVLPLLMRYYQTNPQQLPKVIRAVVAFYSLWRAAFPTNSLPDIYRGLLTSYGAHDMSMSPRSEKNKPAAVRNLLKSPKQLADYFRNALDVRLGSPSSGMSSLDHWVSKQTNFDYEQAKSIIRLFIIIDMGNTYKPNLLGPNPWTKLDDIDHIFPEAGSPAPSNLHKIGNLTFLPPVVNKSIKDMQWHKKKDIYSLLCAATRQPVPPTHFAGGDPLPSAVSSYLADSTSPCLAHLGSISSHTAWDEKAIDARSVKMLSNIWKVLYEKWLTL